MKLFAELTRLRRELKTLKAAQKDKKNRLNYLIDNGYVDIFHDDIITGLIHLRNRMDMEKKRFLNLSYHKFDSYIIHDYKYHMMDMDHNRENKLVNVEDAQLMLEYLFTNKLKEFKGHLTVRGGEIFFDDDFRNVYVSYSYREN